MTVAEVYGACPTKQRASRREMTERLDALYEITRASQPTGCRFVYYRAVVQGLVPKTQAGYSKVQRALLTLRESGRVPYSWIVDSSRWMRKPESWDSIEALLDDVTASYRRNLWRDTDTVVEVWAESESVAGVLYSATSKWDVPLFPCKGQSSVPVRLGSRPDLSTRGPAGGDLLRG